MHKSRRGVEPARARAVAHQFCELVRSERSKQPVLGCAGRQSASSLQADCVTPLGDTNTEKEPLINSGSFVFRWNCNIYRTSIFLIYIHIFRINIHILILFQNFSDKKVIIFALSNLSISILFRYEIDRTAHYSPYESILTNRIV